MDFTSEYLQKQFNYNKFKNDCPNTAKAICAAINEIKVDCQNELIDLIIERYSDRMSPKLCKSINNLKFIR